MRYKRMLFEDGGSIFKSRFASDEDCMVIASEELIDQFRLDNIPQ